jgi:hypothetical protein
MPKYQSNQRLWKIIQEVDGYYYEIRLAGVVIDRFKVDEKAFERLQKMESV